MITLATLPEATAQEVFDQVAVHLLTQKKKSAVTTKLGITNCKYRSTKQGQKLQCAAGCLMSDDEYRESFEGHDWWELALYGSVSDNHKKLIRKLQIIHDEEHPNAWCELLIELAEEEGLNIDAIHNIKYETVSKP